MTRARWLPLVTKEIRALSPIWLAVVCAMGAGAVSGRRAHEMAMLAFCLGSSALGAVSIGHEYTHRTLTLLLAQPVSRRRLLLMKLGVLMTMLLTLWAAASILLDQRELQWDFEMSPFLFVLCAMFLAPLLTIVCRNPLAGVAFTVAAPVWVSKLMEFVSVKVVWAVVAGVCAVAAVSSWRLFMRLEPFDGSDPELHLSRMWRGPAAPAGAAPVAPARHRHAVWLLVKKELHLQQMTLAVAGVIVVMWTTAWAVKRIVPGFDGTPLTVARDADTGAAVAIMCGVLLAFLIGSLASAEERHIGTLDWQVLLPMATWKQWAVKAGMALGLATLLSFGMPVWLASGAVGFNASHAAAIIMVTAGSLYLSSLSSSGLRALLLSIPVMVVLMLLLPLVPTAVGRSIVVRPFVPLAGFVALVLWFGHQNHRISDHGARRVCWQVLWIAGCLALGVAASAVMTAFQ